MYTYNGNKVNTRKGFTESNGTQHPQVIFTKWSREELEAIGLVYVEETPVAKPDTRFYWENGTPRILEDREEFEEDGTTPQLNEDGTQMVTKGLKTNAIALVKRQAGDILRETDWLVTRATEDSTSPVPAEVTTYRASVRTKSNDIETAITACTTLEQFMVLYDTPVDADGMPTGNATIVDWPIKG